LDHDNNSSEAGVVSRILSTFLNELDGITSSSLSSQFDTLHMMGRVFVIAACTNSNTLDKALLRPGRLSYQITLFPPDRHDIKEIFQYYLSKIQPLADDISYDQLVDLYCNQDGLTEDSYSSSEIISICRDAINLAVKDNIHALQETDMTNQQPPPPQQQQLQNLRMDHFEKILIPKQKKIEIRSEFTIDLTKKFTF
jgi:SpoVK/Ycf46/Vps4 family AAA+-type ATPase